MVANGGLKGACSAITTGGQQCTAPPLRDGQFCLWHDPAHADEVAEARRRGGLRRRKETAVGGAYDFEGLSTVPQIRRLVEVAVIDTLAQENTIGRSRALGHLAHTAQQLLQTGELEDRLARIEQALEGRKR
jgi:hypothetical protein